MLDLISGGRIISGFVRGTGIEQLSTNANPAYNRERFEEAQAILHQLGERLYAEQVEQALVFLKRSG